MARRQQLCVCGRSANLPWCDGSHSAEDWSCDIAGEVPAFGFMAPGRIGNLARKLAAAFDGLLVREREPGARVQHFVVLVDGSDVLDATSLGDAVSFDTCTVFGLGVPCAALQRLYPGVDRHLTLPRMPLPMAFREVHDQLRNGLPTPVPRAPKPNLRSAFVSHAVVDEAVILPVVNALRERIGADVFLCADSIALGQQWHAEIEAALASRDVFVLVLSEAAARSTFCAFEVGVAVGAGKPIVIVSLDGTLPPAYVQHIHMFDAVRMQRTFPWLDADDVLLEGLLGALGSEGSQPGAEGVDG